MLPVNAIVGNNIMQKCGLEIYAVSGPDSSKGKINRNIWA
jgi:hypothetical protein